MLSELSIINQQEISQEKAEDAIRTLLMWIGENPEREGLIETPSRVIKSFTERFSGYSINPDEVLEKRFSETAEYDEMVMLSNIEIESCCEHHMLPIIGKAHVAYIPSEYVVGISKLARVVEVFSKRLQLQERLTSQIANAIQENLNPKGVAVMIQAKHHCICHRGIHHRKTMMSTSTFLGEFKSDTNRRNEFINMI